MPYFRLPDAEIYYETHGDGPPLVLLPGFGTGLWIWYQTIPALARDFRVIVFDPRGVARSTNRAGFVPMRGLADDVAALLGHLQIAEAHILGASFGGFVAQELALAYPQMTRKLILCCTSFGGAGHVIPTPETLAALASTKGLNTEERMRENLLLAFSADYVRSQPAEIERIIALRAANPVPEHVYLQQLQAAMGFSIADRLSAITAPTLIVTGDADIIVPPANSYNLAARIPHAELKIVRGGSHTFFIEQAAEFNRLVRQFLT